MVKMRIRDGLFDDVKAKDVAKEIVKKIDKKYENIDVFEKSSKGLAEI